MIQRYGQWPEQRGTVRDDPSGEWVKYADHLAALAACRKETIEACAKVADGYAASARECAQKGSYEMAWRFAEAEHIAAAIRGMGVKE